MFAYSESVTEYFLMHVTSFILVPLWMHVCEGKTV